MMTQKCTHGFLLLLILCAFFLPMPHKVAAQSLASMEKQIIAQTNAFRRIKGLKRLVVNKTLQRTAKAFACFMARTGKYGHHADGRKPSQRAQIQGFPKKGCVGENIAWNNYPRIKQANILTNGWINSPPHRKNMLTPGAKITGVAVCQKGRKFYAVQLIGRLNRVSIEIRNKTPYPVYYRYGNRGGQPHTGTVPGHPNGWRSLTLSTCEYARLTAFQKRASRYSKIKNRPQSRIIGEKKQTLVFGK